MKTNFSPIFYVFSISITRNQLQAIMKHYSAPVEQFSVMVRESRQNLQSGSWVSKGWEPLVCADYSFM